MYMAMEDLAPFVRDLYKNRAYMSRDEIVRRAEASELAPELKQAAEQLPPGSYERGELLEKWTLIAQQFIPYSFGERG